jgi:hypothetical protein
MRDIWKAFSEVAVAGLIVWLGVVVTGCRHVQGAADQPDKSKATAKAAKDPAELQQQLFRFTDQYLAQLLGAVEQLDAADPRLTREMAQRIRVGYAGDVWMAASGPNIYADLLDLVTVIALSRIVIEEHWIPEIFGDSAAPLLKVVSNAERDIWTIAAGVLSAEEQDELRQAIRIWREENPEAVNAMYVRAIGLAKSVADASPSDRARSRSVFRFLMVDPLAGLDPATRELAQTRLTAERAVYIAQRLPFVMRWQGELLSVRLADMPETKQLLTNSAELTDAVTQLLTNSRQLTDAVTQLSQVAEQLPDQFTKQGQEIIKTLESEQEGLLELSAELRSTLHAGAQTASNSHLALSSLDTVLQRLHQYNSDSNGELLRMSNYTEAAKQLEVTALHLSDFLLQLDESLASINLHELVDEVAPVVESSGRELVDHAFKRLLLLLVIACGLFLVTAFLQRRMTRGPGGIF